MFAPDPYIQPCEVTSPLLWSYCKQSHITSRPWELSTGLNSSHKYHPLVSWKTGFVKPRHQDTRLLNIHTGSGTDHATPYQ